MQLPLLDSSNSSLSSSPRTRLPTAPQLKAVLTMAASVTTMMAPVCLVVVAVAKRRRNSSVVISVRSSSADPPRPPRRLPRAQDPRDSLNNSSSVVVVAAATITDARTIMEHQERQRRRRWEHSKGRPQRRSVRSFCSVPPPPSLSRSIFHAALASLVPHPFSIAQLLSRSALLSIPHRRRPSTSRPLRPSLSLPLSSSSQQQRDLLESTAAFVQHWGSTSGEASASDPICV